LIAQKRTSGAVAPPLPLLGSNQDSPDPEGSVKAAEFQQLQGFTPVRVTLLEFDDLHATLCLT
jgi:hypothetical protein